MVRASEVAGQLGLRQANGVYYGRYDTLWLTVKETERGFIIAVNLNDGDNAKKITKRVMEIPNVSAAHMEDNMLHLQFDGQALSAADVPAVLDAAIACFTKLGAACMCHFCSDSAPVGWYAAEGETVAVCAHCLKEIPAVNGGLGDGLTRLPVRSIFGGILGAFVGSIAWIAIGLLGYIAVIGGVAISAASWFLYKILGGKRGAVAAVVIALSSLIAMIFGEYVGWVIEAMRQVGDISIGAAIGVIFEMLTDGDLPEFYKDLGIGLIALVVGMIPFFKWLRQGGKLKNVRVSKLSDA